jgi:peptidoglycan biosynthesis protein MviN/MurJ (putative lipid II flippase)
MNLFQWVFGGLLAVALVVTVWGYPRKYGALSGRSRLFRTVGILLLDLLLITIVMYFSTDWLAMRFRVGIETEKNIQLIAASKLLYFTTWVIITILTLGMGMLDALENFTVYRKQRREALDDMIQDAIAASQAKRLATAGGEGGSKES